MAESHTSFKQRKSFDERKQEVKRIREQFPNKIPVILEQYSREKSLPALDRSRFLLPEDLTIAQFSSIVRNRLSVSANQAFYMIVNKRTLVSLNETLSSLYETDSDEDGFLYVTYASQDAFGACTS